MNKSGLLLSIGIAALLAGCGSQSHSVAVTPLPSPAPKELEVSNVGFTPVFTPVSHVLMYRDVSLSLRAPRDAGLQMRLLSIRADTTTTIRLDSGEELSAKPGECFSCSEFGTSGLQLISASPKAGAAVFRRTTCESQ